MRIGFGYDIHPLTTDRKLILGGVHIDYPRGLAGHSDGDALTHAIIDALLGALGEGDIGKEFGIDRPEYKDISSLLLLKHVAQKIKNLPYTIGNIDATIVAEEPYLAPYIEKMRINIAETLTISTKQVNIKATTSKGLGVVGAKAAIAVYCVVNLI